MKVRTSRVIAFALLAIVTFAGCDRGESVSHFRVPKGTSGPRPETPAAATPGMPASLDVPPPATAPAGGALRWTLPKGWTETQGGPMRFASFKPPVGGRIDASVVVLPGPAGGELANVNRWRNQIGLPPLDEAGLAATRKVVQTRAGLLDVYDFTSEGATRSRVVAGLTTREGSTWFVKLSGDAEAVSAARADFMNLLGSLRFE